MFDRRKGLLANIRPGHTVVCLARYLSRAKGAECFGYCEHVTKTGRMHIVLNGKMRKFYPDGRAFSREGYAVVMRLEDAGDEVKERFRMRFYKNLRDVLDRKLRTVLTNTPDDRLEDMTEKVSALLEELS